MSFLKNVKPNKPIVGLEGYFMTILGKSKFGKTTFVYDLIKEYYNGDLSKALLLAPEIGYKTLDGIHALPISDFKETDDDEKEEMGVYGFIETVDELIENKNEVPYKAIIIDTITALEELAITYVVKKEARKAGKTGKWSALGDVPYGQGYTALANAIYGEIDRLKKAGFAVILIGHEKTQQIEQRDGKTYNLITLNCQKKTTDIIEREADLIIYGDLVTEVKGDTVSQERLLRFRSDGNIICGSRFRTMPDSIELDVPLFLETFKQAVIDSFNGNEEELKKAEKEQKEEREKKADKFIEKSKEENPDDLIEEIEELIGEIKDSGKVSEKEIKGVIKNHNNNKVNYKKIDDMETLKNIIEDLKEL